MNTFYVYLDLMNRRLLISENHTNDYQLLMSSTDREFAKMYCMGFIYGNSAQGYTVVNKAEEFA